MTAPCKQRRISAPKTDVQAAAAILKALADPHRLTILLALRDGEACVCDLNDSLPLEQPAVSHHLRVLKEEGLITGERRGTWVYYRLDEGAKDRLGDVVGAIASLVGDAGSAVAAARNGKSRNNASGRPAKTAPRKAPTARRRPA